MFLPCEPIRQMPSGGRIGLGGVNNTTAAAWLDAELERVMPRADDLLTGMKVELCFKDLTYETLNSDEFLEAVRAAFPGVNWHRAHDEFLAAAAKERTA
jgi:hypothetical protein